MEMALTSAVDELVIRLSAKVMFIAFTKKEFAFANKVMNAIVN